MADDPLDLRPRRLGRNASAYLGETIDIAAVLQDIAGAARAAGWRDEGFLTKEGMRLDAWVRPAPGLAPGATPRRIYISTGIHGDEPAGPSAVRELVRQNEWPANAEIWLCPCLNPTGFPLNRRENAQGIDLNRQYLHFAASETRAHADWLLRQPAFDVCLCLHEDWESHGFYVYELNPDGQVSYADAIIREVARHCPIDLSTTIEGRTAAGGIIRPDVDPASRPQWPESFFLLMNRTRLSYTLEAPSDFELEVRVCALVNAVRAVIHHEILEGAVVGVGTSIGKSQGREEPVNRGRQ